MRISIVTSYFFPVPAVRGGAMEKTWWAVSKEWAARGHEITFICRAWPGMPVQETREGVRFLRLPGRDLSGRPVQNLLSDFFWSRRVFAILPVGDFVISNSPCLPLWFRTGNSKAGRVLPVIARMPKGQLVLYGRVALVLALSRAVQERIAAQSPACSAVTVLFPLPIDVKKLTRTGAKPLSRKVRLGYIGRLHPEKGLELLLEAAARLCSVAGLVEWELLIAGPVAVREGGGGEEWWQTLRAKYQPSLRDRLSVVGPEFDETALAELYRSIDIFCYPSLAERGETFGAAVAEAMAAGCVPVVSALECFRDLVMDRVNGRTFVHTEFGGPQNLALVLEDLLGNPIGRTRLANAASASVQTLDYSTAASRLEKILEGNLNAVPSARSC